jgi:hypothetical protein
MLSQLIEEEFFLVVERGPNLGSSGRRVEEFDAAQRNGIFLVLTSIDSVRLFGSAR